MTVGALRSYLSDLSRFVAAGGAKKELTDDLGAVVNGLAPFDNQSLRDFCGFLIRAEEFHRTGQLPVTGQSKGRTPTRAAAGGGGVSDVGAVKNDIQSFYNRANSPDVTVEMIEAKRETLAPLTKPQLAEVAGAIDLRVPSNKNKGQIIDMIIAAIRKMGDDARRVKQ